MRVSPSIREVNVDPGGGGAMFLTTKETCRFEDACDCRNDFEIILLLYQKKKSEGIHPVQQ